MNRIIIKPFGLLALLTVLASKAALAASPLSIADPLVAKSIDSKPANTQRLKAKALDIQQASQYKGSTDISEYWVSEKLDGVRGYWDGKKMYTRAGNQINLPVFFTAGWPTEPLEGELWTKRGDFETISGLIQRKQTKASQWKNVKFMLFDLPTHQGTFTERIRAMRAYVQQAKNPHLRAVEQYRVANNQLLQNWLEEAIRAGSEGLMLHKADALYQTGRSANILKLKPMFDAEAEVIAHLPGKGKYQGKLGAIIVKANDGIEFKIGTGFSDQERQDPPPIGSIITFKYSGKTKKGVPRFASFLRVRYLAKLE